MLSEKTAQAYAEACRSCANRLTADGLDLGSYGIAQQVDDMEAARVALGYNKINLLGESAGTRTAIIYSWRYPDSIHRAIMIGVNPPGHILFYPDTTDEQIERYAALCAKDESCRARTEISPPHCGRRTLRFPIMTKELLPYLRNGHEVVLPGLRRQQPRDSRRPLAALSLERGWGSTQRAALSSS